MFELFTERSRQVMVFAQDEARVLGHNSIGSEHTLLTLMRQNDGTRGTSSRRAHDAERAASAALMIAAGVNAKELAIQGSS
jgi:ATP-dependent Clp protease ATP-binding subunit ClpA